MPRYRIELQTDATHREAIAEELVGEEVQIERAMEGDDYEAVVVYGSSGEIIGLVPPGTALHRRMNDDDDLDTEDIYALVQSIDVETLAVVLDVRTGTQAETARNRASLERQKERELRRAAMAPTDQGARPQPPANPVPPQNTWVEDLLDWAGLGAKVPRAPFPGQQPPGWQAGPYAKPPPNSFQSCMGCLGWVVVGLIALFIFASALPKG